MIPEAAVEAAAAVIALGEMEKTHYLRVARAALEAAAPRMRLAADLAGADEAELQLIRDIAGVDAATAESLGY